MVASAGSSVAAKVTTTKFFFDATPGNLTVTGNFIGTATSAQYADLAENFVTDVDYDPGTVVIFGGENEITASTSYADTALAGVISTAPAYLMNSDEQNAQPLVLAGRAPCKVIGPINKGDVLTSSDVVGCATKLNKADWEPGVTLGKALSSCKEGEHLIEIVVGPC